MGTLEVKGISYRFNDMFYVDVEPNVNMKTALEEEIQKQKNFVNEDDYLCGAQFLSVAYDIKGVFHGLVTWISDLDWIDIPYEFTKTEKKEVIEFINKWKDKVPTNIDGYKYADDTEYVYALSNDIPWKYKVLR